MKALGAIAIGMLSVFLGLPVWAGLGVMFISYLAFGK